MGSPVFKTGEGLKSPWRVRFPSASATCSRVEAAPACRRPGYRCEVTIRPRTGAVELQVTGLARSPGAWSRDDLAGVPGHVPDLGALAEGFAGDAAPLRPILDAAEPAAEATHATVISDDGHYRASIPLSELRERGWVAFALDGEALPRERGGPLRVVVPQGRTLCWNVKGAVEIELTAGPQPDSVPENPPH